MRTPKKGDEVRITFRDHMTNADELTTYCVYGRIHKITEEAITVDYWTFPDPETPRKLGDEVECATIMRKVIEGVSVVTEWKDL